MPLRLWKLPLYALSLAFASLLLAAALAWSYVDDTSRQGLVYWWFFAAPAALHTYVGNREWAAVAMTLLVYTAQYLALLYAVRSAWRVLVRSNPSFQRTASGGR